MNTSFFIAFVLRVGALLQADEAWTWRQIESKGKLLHEHIFLSMHP
jgi:hypothetical protein